MTNQPKRFPCIPLPAEFRHWEDPDPEPIEIVKHINQAQQIMGCRWIDGDVGQPGWRYCQKPRLGSRSYCAAHHVRSINPQGDNHYPAEAAECDLYLRDLPPPNDAPDGDDFRRDSVFIMINLSNKFFQFIFKILQCVLDSKR